MEGQEKTSKPFLKKEILETSNTENIKTDPSDDLEDPLAFPNNLDYSMSSNMTHVTVKEELDPLKIKQEVLEGDIGKNSFEIEPTMFVDVSILAENEIKIENKCMETTTQILKAGLISNTNNESHKQVTHDKVRYSCDQTTADDNLQKTTLIKRERIPQKKNITKRSCNKCQFKAKYPSDIIKHMEAVHEGVRYNCDQCEYQTKYKSDINKHKQSIHEGMKLCCDQCEFQARSKKYLKIHHQSVHEGVRYSCDQCDYNGEYKDQLRAHKLYKHNGVGYFCDQCDYKTLGKRNLKIHQQSIHEGVKYSCNQCEYKTGWAALLNQHRKKQHKNQSYSSK